MIDVVAHVRRCDQVEADIVDEQSRHGAIIAEFHRVFHGSVHTHAMTYFEGIPVLQNPLDLWVLGEILWDLRPTLYIETGTAFGGTALFAARHFDKLGAGRVISIDIEPNDALPKHDRVTYVKGSSSTKADVVTAVGDVAATHPRVMVALDSCHECDHVLAELDAYGPMVTNGQFLVVCDTDLNGRPVDAAWQGGPGPGIAVDVWLPQHPEFRIAKIAERYLISSHTWLRREK